MRPRCCATTLASRVLSARTLIERCVKEARRRCRDCGEPVTAERKVCTWFCSPRCANRHYKRRQREREAGIEFEVSLDELIVDIRFRKASVFGVETDPDIADVLREESRRF